MRCFVLVAVLAAALSSRVFGQSINWNYQRDDGVVVPLVFNYVPNFGATYGSMPVYGQEPSHMFMSAPITYVDWEGNVLGQMKAGVFLHPSGSAFDVRFQVKPGGDELIDYGNAEYPTSGSVEGGDLSIDSEYFQSFQVPEPGLMTVACLLPLVIQRRRCCPA